MQCPKCKSDIDADSWYCDQCGEMIMMCPKCNEPRKGKRCTQCGTVLVAAKDIGAGAANTTISSNQSNPTAANAAQTNNTAPNNTASNAASPSGLPPLSGFGKSPSQAPQQPQQQPPQQPAGGTMRPQPTGPTRMVSIDDPARVVVFRDGAVIGRKQGDYLNVFADNGYTSGRHAQLSRAGADWLIIDLDSTNGTAIDGKALTPNQGYKLQPGQIVEIGYKKFRVE